MLFWHIDRLLIVHSWTPSSEESRFRESMDWDGPQGWGKIFQISMLLSIAVRMFARVFEDFMNSIFAAGLIEAKVSSQESRPTWKLDRLLFLLNSLA